MKPLDYYLSMPWSIVREEASDDGDYLILRIKELPGFLVAGDTDEELSAEFWPALSEFLRAYLSRGWDPPMPEGAVWVGLSGGSADPPQPAVAMRDRQPEVQYQVASFGSPSGATRDLALT